jgi:hypothetical protein
MPNRGDKVKTPDGMAIVVDTNILLELVKVRHMMKGSNELSEDIVAYNKGEIKVVEVNRSSHHHNKNVTEEGEPVDFAELKKLED